MARGCPSLLLEPQRTNLIGYSEYLTNFNAYSPTSSISVNAAISPEGVQNACEFTYTGSGNDFAYSQPTFTTTGASVFSVYMRVASGTKSVSLRTWNTGVFNAVNVTTEWQRFELNLPSALSNERIGIDNRVTYGGSATAGTIEVWGAQLEQATYATSYIPNYGTTAGVTRVADACSGAGSASTFNSPAGVMYWEGSILSNTTAAGAISLIGAGSQRVQLYNSGSNMNVYLEVSGVLVFSATTSGVDITTNHKYAIRWAVNDFSLWVDGVEVATASSGATFSASALTELRFSDPGSSYLYAQTNKFSPSTQH